MCTQAQILIPYTVHQDTDTTQKKVKKKKVRRVFDQYLSFWRFSLE